MADRRSASLMTTTGACTSNTRRLVVKEVLQTGLSRRSRRALKQTQPATLIRKSTPMTIGAATQAGTATVPGAGAKAVVGAKTVASDWPSRFWQRPPPQAGPHWHIVVPVPVSVHTPPL